MKINKEWFLWPFLGAVPNRFFFCFPIFLKNGKKTSKVPKKYQKVPNRKKTWYRFKRRHSLRYRGVGTKSYPFFVLL